MSPFEKYAAYYDEMYPNKDYAAEALFVCALLREYARPDIKSILELGSGTGRHAVELAVLGYTIHGVDLSESMVGFANARKSTLPEELKESVSFSVGDVRSLRLGAQFDVVLALFHVASYQTTNEDFFKFISTARDHLRPEGILIFDFWYGPAVLWQRPEVRIKRVENETGWIVRVAEPAPKFDENCVVVKYEIIDVIKQTGEIRRFNEDHKLRFFFLPDLRLVLRSAGIEMLAVCEWLNPTAKPSTETWSVCLVAKRHSH